MRPSAPSPAASDRCGPPRRRAEGARPTHRAQEGERSGAGLFCVKCHIYFRTEQASRVHGRPGPEAPAPSTGQGGPGPEGTGSRRPSAGPGPPAGARPPSMPLSPVRFHFGWGSQSCLYIKVCIPHPGGAAVKEGMGGITGRVRGAGEIGAREVAKVACKAGDIPQGCCQPSLPQRGVPQPSCLLCRFAGLRQSFGFSSSWRMCPFHSRPSPAARAALRSPG